MSMHDVRNMGSHESPGLIAMGDVAGEVRRAREKFPRNAHMLAALMEEVGELAQAFLQGQTNEEIRAEAMQVACVAIRIMEEGCGDFPKAKPSEGLHVYEPRTKKKP